MKTPRNTLSRSRWCYGHRPVSPFRAGAVLDRYIHPQLWRERLLSSPVRRRATISARKIRSSADPPEVCEKPLLPRAPSCSFSSGRAWWGDFILITMGGKFHLTS